MLEMLDKTIWLPVGSGQMSACGHDLAGEQEA